MSRLDIEIDEWKRALNQDQLGLSDVNDIIAALEMEHERAEGRHHLAQFLDSTLFRVIRRKNRLERALRATWASRRHWQAEARWFAYQSLKLREQYTELEADYQALKARSA